MKSGNTPFLSRSFPLRRDHFRSAVGGSQSRVNGGNGVANAWCRSWCSQTRHSGRSVHEDITSRDAEAVDFRAASASTKV